MLANEVAIIIGQFAAVDELVVASQLTDELVKYLPDYEYGTKMRNAFKNETLDDEQKKQAVVEIAKQAYNELNDILLIAYIDARLQNVIENSLYQKFAALSLVNGSRSAPSRMAGFKLEKGNEPLLVSVLLTSSDDEVLNSLQEVGLKIIAKPVGSSFVVGEIQTEKIANVALIQAVKWIEPAKVTKQ